MKSVITRRKGDQVLFRLQSFSTDRAVSLGIIFQLGQVGYLGIGEAVSLQVHEVVEDGVEEFGERRR